MDSYDNSKIFQFSQGSQGTTSIANSPVKKFMVPPLGPRLDGAEMLACGLATHFVPSAKLPLLEKALISRAASASYFI
ncbi:unnamed protein product [Prunus armeniaca]